MPYKVLVDDNYHHMDEESRYELGVFETRDEALAAAKRIVDDFLSSSLRPGMTAEELYTIYVGFGEDPFIVPVTSTDEGLDFSAWSYARDRCAHIAPSRDREPEEGSP